MYAVKLVARVLAPGFAVLAAAWLVVASCAEHEAHEPRAVDVTASDDSGEPLAEVTIEVAKRARGTSDARGKLRLALRPEELVRVRCPEAYRPAQAQPASAADGRGALPFVCRPRLRTIAVVVSAPAARGLVLRADAQSLGRVDDRGLLHAVLKRAPGSTLSLSLAARGAEREQPFATRTLQVEDRDRIVLFELAGPGP